MFSIANGRIITDTGRVVRGSVSVRGGSIASIRRTRTVSGKVYDVGGMYVSPGFIDLHVHGGCGRDFINASAADLHLIQECHSRYGTTGMLATIRTDSEKQMAAAIAAATAAMGRRGTGAAVLGVHLEGPFLSQAKRGAQSARHIRKPDPALLRDLLSSGSVRILTLAPEEDGAIALVDDAASLGIICAIGHSSATYQQAADAIEWGVSYAVHAFNAMRGLGHREPGAAGAVLDRRGVTAEIIADGYHLHPAMVRIILMAKGIDGIVLVTDCMEALGSEEDAFRVAGREVRVRGGAPRFSSGVLCGSVLTMNRAVKNLMEFTGIGLTEAVRPATITPARLLKMEKKKGSLRVGKDADIAVFDDDLNVGLVVSGGKVVFNAL